jgi:hypothetical protein
MDQNSVAAMSRNNMTGQLPWRGRAEMIAIYT